MRLHTALVAAATLALALSPLACAGAEDEDPTSSPTEEGSAEDEIRAMSLTDADDGKTVTVTKGQNVIVKLSANPTTGYKWVVASTDRTFGYPSSDTFAGGGASAPVGSGGIQKLTWKTKSPLDMTGSHTVKLEYKRSWENNVAPAKTFSFTVKVVDGSCPTLSPPRPGFCTGGSLVPTRDANGCTIGYDCDTTARN